MNLAVANGTGTGFARENRRVLAGVGVSIAIHLLLLFAYRNASQVPAFESAPSSSIAVRILPPAPPPVPPRVEQPLEPAVPARPRGERKSRPGPVIAVPASPQEERSPDPFSVQQSGEAAPADSEAPRFSMDAARQTARQLAGQTRLGREDSALAQFPDPPLETETKAARAIGKAKRRNCKDGIPGGLLAPLFLMMDKKDSGCKW